jgi:maltose/maltodextrin transport system substrate-binding protein
MKMMQRTIFYLAALMISLCLPPPALCQARRSRPKEAFSQTVTPVRPGVPGKLPFWNGYARRFIYAPAFDFQTVPGAKAYRFEVWSGEQRDHFRAATPYAALSPVWPRVPVGWFTVKVTGLSASGDSLGLAGKGRYYRAAPYQGVYGKALMPYDSSALLALKTLMHERYVDYWLAHGGPDTTYLNYRYPAKIWSALVTGAVLYARLSPDPAEARRARKIALTVADALLQVSFPAGTPLAFLPPTYYGNHMGSGLRTPIRHDNYLTIEAPDAGSACLDLYRLTGTKRYLEAAENIARTFLRTQLKSGSWYLFVNPRTGKPNAPNIAIPTAMIRFFDRLGEEVQLPGLKEATTRALQWTMEHPARTFDWQGQFVDVYARPPYRNQSREQACDLAVYLFRHHQHISLAEELTRYAEDQFVIWGKPRALGGKRGMQSGRNAKNWVTPCVQEQYVFWMPVTRSAGIMIDTYRSAFEATGKRIYLEKAISIANSIETVQQEHKGAYPAFLTPKKMPQWLNNTVYPAEAMMALAETVRKAAAEGGTKPPRNPDSP